MVTTQDLLTGTDSLMYKIKTEDVYADFSNDKEIFDFNDYYTKSKYYENSNKLVVAITKDETAGACRIKGKDEFVFGR